MVRKYVKVGVHRHKGRLDDAKRDLAIQLIRRGQTTVQIVNESGVSRSQVQRLRRKLQDSGELHSVAGIIEGAKTFSKNYMTAYDPSHDYSHIQRVLAIARRIEASHRQTFPDLAIDSDVVTLACLLHDVGDKKYLQPSQDPTTMVQKALEMLGATPALALKVQRIVSNVSYSTEMESPLQVQAVLAQHPELGIVQDADRLDAMGAVGIGRAFTYNAAKTRAQEATTMDDPVAHIEDKLLKLGALMKTPAGKLMADEREVRLRLFQDWWKDEVNPTI